MRNCWTICLLLGTVAWAQARPAAPAAAPATQSATGKQDEELTPASNVAPDAAVLTIKGLCSRPASNAGPEAANSACETVITRAQFEKLVDAIQPAMDAQSKRQFATAYPQTLMMAHEAEERGLDKQPRFEERLRFARIQILSQELVHQIQEDAAQVPETDIEDYYHKHTSEFEEGKLERIVIPNRRQMKSEGTSSAADAAKAAEDAMAQEAEILHQRALQGEDFTKLQKEAFAFAGVSGNNSPNPMMDNMRRRGLPLAHAAVFDLKPGQVSAVLSDATGHYIYKLDSKSIAPLDAVRQEIRNTLRRERVQRMIQSVQQPYTTEVNRAYFGASTGKDSD